MSGEMVGMMIGVISACLGVYGLYQGHIRKKLEKFQKQNIWALYRDASVIFGGLQRLQGDLQHGDIRLKLGELTSQAENLMNNQIKEICITEKITSKKLDKWVNDKKICDVSHRDIFNKYME